MLSAHKHCVFVTISITVRSLTARLTCTHGKHSNLVPVSGRVRVSGVVTITTVQDNNHTSGCRSATKHPPMCELAVEWTQLATITVSLLHSLLCADCRPLTSLAALIGAHLGRAVVYLERSLCSSLSVVRVELSIFILVSSCPNRCATGV